MKRLFLLLLILLIPTTAFADSSHPYIKPEREMAIPELGVPAPVHPGPLVIRDLPEFPAEGLYPPKKPNLVARTWKKIPKVDRDLLPGYLFLAAGAVADLYSTHEVIRLGNGQIVEGNVVLVRAEEFAEKLHLPSGAGRDAVSATLTVGYAVVVRNYIYPRWPRLAKVALYVGGAFRFGLYFWNNKNLEIIRLRQ